MEQEILGKGCVLKKQQKTIQTLFGGFKDRRFEVGMEPTKGEFRATSTHVSAREKEEVAVEGRMTNEV